MPNTSDGERVVRVFVSSTFRDMQEERNYLVKHVFPELRNRCRSRRVDFVEVDLRWGITEEQAQYGEVVPTCLAQIDNCRPFFIGILGQRYGWIPPGIDESLLNAYEWLREHRGKSVTELEILHGALNDPASAEVCRFYFRDPEYAARIAPDQRADFLPENEDSLRKLEDLKSRICQAHRRHGHVVLRENYPDATTLGQWILDDLWQAIDSRYAEDPFQSDLDREAAEHHAFAEGRAKGFVPRPRYAEAIDAHVAGDGSPLVILGESGIGKSSLLANWALEYASAHPGTLVLLHFIGISPQSADYEKLLARMLGEIRRQCDLKEEVPEAAKDLVKAFPEWLQRAADREPVVLVLDGLNHLEDRDGAPDLVWLPEQLPNNVLLVASTLPGRSLQAVKERGWSTLEVEALALEERYELIVRHLGRFGKLLDQKPLERIIATPRTGNPLYLRALLEELRVFGVFEKLSDRIGHYLSAPDVPTLYDRILQRMEEDYEGQRQGLVGDALSYLWASRRGLHEQELLELLGSRKNPLPQAVWSPFFLAIRESLVSRSGLLGFFHDYLRQAVHRRYLAKPEADFERHRALAQYFNCMFSVPGRAEEYRSLAAQAAGEALKLAERTGNEFLKAEACLLMADRLIHAAVGVSHDNPELFAEAWKWANRGCQVARKTGDPGTLARGLCMRARIETEANPDYGNFALIDEAVRLYRSMGDREGERGALLDKAVLAMRKEEWRLAETSLQQAEQTHFELPNPERMWSAHIAQVRGEYLAAVGSWQQAARILEKARDLYHQENYAGGVCAAEGWLGIAKCFMGDSDAGLSLVRRALKYERDELGSQEGVAKWLHALGEFYHHGRQPELALDALWLCEFLREAQNHSELPKTRGKLAEIRRADPQGYQELEAGFNLRESHFGQYAFLWGLGPFRKHPENPILSPGKESWESHAVFNPAAWTDGQTVCLLYRAEGPSGDPKGKLISCIGLAESADGIHFKRETRPVMEPTEPYEAGGGCEDPRLVRINDTFYLTYTAFDGKTARLALARSSDLRNWEKLGLVFEDEQLEQLEDSNVPRGWVKSGAILSRRVNGRYWMFFGDTNIWVATSKDLRSWQVVPKPVLSPRTGGFDSQLVEPGPPPVMLSDVGPPPLDGIWLGYNSAQKTERGTLRYQFGQALLAPYDPTHVLRRCTRPLLEPTTPKELHGQVSEVVFAEGLALFRGRWHLYYGMADSRIGVALSKVYASPIE